MIPEKFRKSNGYVIFENEKVRGMKIDYKRSE